MINCLIRVYLPVSKGYCLWEIISMELFTVKSSIIDIAVKQFN